MNFEQRLKDLISEKFTESNRQWEHLSTEDWTDFNKIMAQEMGLKAEEAATHYWTLEGEWDIHFLFEETTINHQSVSYRLILSNKKAEFTKKGLDTGLDIATIIWSSGPLFEDTNGIAEVEMKLLSPFFRPFDRFDYLSDLLSCICRIKL